MGGGLSDKLSGMSMAKFLEKWKHSNSNLFDLAIHDIIKMLPSTDSDRCLTANEIIQIESKISKIEILIGSSDQLSHKQKVHYNNQITRLWDRVNIEKELLLPLDKLSLRLYNLEIDSQYNDLQTNCNELQSIKDELQILQHEQQSLRKEYERPLFNYRLSNNHSQFSSDEIEKINQITNYDAMMKNLNITERITILENQLMPNQNRSAGSTYSFYNPKRPAYQSNTPSSNSVDNVISNNPPTSLKN